MLAGHYPGDEFAELRPRVIWDRAAGTVESRRDARTVARDQRRHDPRSRPVRRLPRRRRRRRQHGRARARASAQRRPAGGRARRGDGLRGARGRGDPARRERLADRADHPRPGAGAARRRASRARCPFWKGDGPGRPVELGRALGEFTRSHRTKLARRVPRGRARAETTAPRRPRPRRAGGAATCSTTWPRSARRRARCRPTGRSSCSASATSWATGGSAC